MPRSLYAARITDTLASLGLVGVDPALVEAWMRLEHGTLDHLAGRAWTAEVVTAAECVRIAEPEDTRALAASYNLVPAEG